MEGGEEGEGGRKGREGGKEGREGGRINAAAVRSSVGFSYCYLPMRGRRVG